MFKIVTFPKITDQHRRSTKSNTKGNDTIKVKSSNKIPKRKKTYTNNKPISTYNQTITRTSGSSTDDDKQKPSPKKVSKLYFDAYSKRPRKQKVYEIEENKQPKDLPTMKLLEAVHGISSHYANENNPELEGLLDTPALLCLGILAEEYTKYCTTDFMEKFNTVTGPSDHRTPHGL